MSIRWDSTHLAVPGQAYPPRQVSGGANEKGPRSIAEGYISPVIGSLLDCLANARRRFYLNVIAGTSPGIP